MGKQRITTQCKDKQRVDEPSEDKVDLAPWLRADNTPILGPGIPAEPDMPPKTIQSMREYQTRDRKSKWEKYISICYNGLLRVNMEPTRFICLRTLQKMGIYTDVKGMLARIGLGTLGSRPYPLYPELVRQFLASVEVLYNIETRPRSDEGVMTFFCNGIKYTMGFDELCEVYHFDNSKKRCVLPTHNEFNESTTL